MIDTLLTGGVVGIAGAFFEKIAGVGLRWIEIKEKDKEREHELKLLDKQAEIRLAETEIEGKIAMQKADAENLSQSYVHDQSSGQGSQWVVNTLRMIRPAITIGLIALTTCIYFSLTEKDATLKQQIIDTVLFTTGTVTLWWFGSRVKAR